MTLLIGMTGRSPLARQDNELSVDEWDRAVDQMFGEDPVNLEVATWDADGNRAISKQEFSRAITQTDVFYTAQIGESRGHGYTGGSPPNLHQFSTVPLIAGEYDVWDWFGELNVPIWESASVPRRQPGLPTMEELAHR